MEKNHNEQKIYPCDACRTYPHAQCLWQEGGSSVTPIGPDANNSPRISSPTSAACNGRCLGWYGYFGQRDRHQQESYTGLRQLGKKDTIYASVDTTGASTATLKAKWTYRKGGQDSVVKEDTQTIAPTGHATSEFNISKPDGWPAGDYQVEIFVDGKSVQTKTFTVK